MAEFPAMPFFFDRYWVKTHHLTIEQHGAYFLLLNFMWHAPQRRIPNDDGWIANRFHITVEMVRTLVRPIVEEFCQNDGNWITQQFLLHQHNWVKQKFQKRSDAAKRRWNKEKNNTMHDATYPNLTKKEDIDQNIHLNGHENADATFAEFWLSYPKKVGKKAAEKKYKAALSEVSHSEIMAGLERSKKNWKDPRFIPHPLTWLNQGRWADEELAPQLEGRFY